MACCSFPYPPPVSYLAAAAATARHRGGPIKPTGGETEKIGATNCIKDTEKSDLERKEETITESHSGLTEEHDAPVVNGGKPSSYSSDSVNRTDPPSGRKRIRLHPAGEVSSSPSSAAARKEENNIVWERSGRRTGANIRRRHRSKSKTGRVPYDAITKGWEFAAIQAAHSESEEDLDWLFNSRKPHARRIEVDWDDDSSFSTTPGPCSMWLKAQWLTSVGEVCALPYTVPF